MLDQWAAALLHPWRKQRKWSRDVEEEGPQRGGGRAAAGAGRTGGGGGS